MISASVGPRRTTGGLLVVSAVAFAAAATVLSTTFDWPDILREPAAVVLPAFVGGGPSLIWTWFATAWTYALLAVPILLLPAALGRADDPALRAATWFGAASVLLSLIGFLRWVFVVPPLARAYVDGDAGTRAAVEAAWVAQHQFGGALLGEHLGQLLVIGWSATLSVIIIRSRVLPRPLGVVGLAVSVAYLLNQGDVLATAVPGFPIWEPAGLIGSTGWGLWVAALGVAVLRLPAAPDRSSVAAAVEEIGEHVVVGDGPGGRAEGSDELAHVAVEAGADLGVRGAQQTLHGLVLRQHGAAQLRVAQARGQLGGGVEQQPADAAPLPAVDDLDPHLGRAGTVAGQVQEPDRQYPVVGGHDLRDDGRSAPAVEVDEQVASRLGQPVDRGVEAQEPAAGRQPVEHGIEDGARLRRGQRAQPHLDTSN